MIVSYLSTRLLASYLVEQVVLRPVLNQENQRRLAADRVRSVLVGLELEVDGLFRVGKGTMWPFLFGSIVSLSFVRS